jgi:muramoyltetrapeptide carboxypeptidase
MPVSIYLISPSYSAAEDLVEQRIRELNSYGENGSFRIIHQSPPTSPRQGLPLLAPLAERLSNFLAALEAADVSVLLATRGGYGASDLLPLIPWQKLRGLSPRLLVGFSDLSCVMSAFWSQLGWPSIHGPMVASPLWGQNSCDDIVQLAALLKNRQEKKGVIRLSPIATAKALPLPPLMGWVFGGCFSVLTNLIGTPYLPKSLGGAFLLFEDTGENYGRLLRHWNQWLQSGMFVGVKGIVFGKFSNLEPGVSEAEVKVELARRCELPCWSSEDFGHISPNYPFVIGAQGVISPGQLHWELEKK